MKILGISAFYHDAAAALLSDGKIIAAAQEERFTRKKHDPAFPSNAIKFCLQYAGCSLNDLDAVVFYDKPFLKFERLLETYYAFAPKGLFSFIQSMPVWIKEKLFLKKIIYEALRNIEDFDKKKVKLLFPEHHLSHAASAYYPSPFEESAILTIDGAGEWATASICKAEGNKIRIIKELNFPHSLGLLYSSFTYYCGFKVNSGEYKLMGLAPYGNKNAALYAHYVEIIKSKLVDIKEDGSVFLDQQYFNYAAGLRMVADGKWKDLFGFERREPESALQQKHCDLALAIQTVTEEIVIKMALEAKRLTGSKHLCMAGGVALNCTANGKLHEAGIFDKIFIQPAAGDAGGALGAAYTGHHIYFNQSRNITSFPDSLNGSFLGPEYTDKEITEAVKQFDAGYKLYESFEELSGVVAALIAGGNVVGWFQGRMEFGPRALGSRSILADPRNPEMQKKLNLKIKFREGFRPFAPAVLAEDVQYYFELAEPSPYMQFVKPVKKARQIPQQDQISKETLLDTLYFLRSDLPAVTHVDYSARIQTVDKDINPLFFQLLQSFKKLTGCSVLINTSFNVRGEPIVNTPLDAYLCFMHTEMDCLVMGNLVFDKIQQPVLKDKDAWRHKFESD
ncbi:MAG TPA: carbamoyltransferase [Chitinophagaceae bacterium]|nr:carbamoyltransferase [Chitinophagaceae bacterium]